MATTQASRQGPDLPDALARCLDQIGRGEPMAAVLESLGDERAALAPLITAAELARTHRPAPEDRFRKRLGELLQVADVEAPEPAARPADPRPSGRQRWRAHRLAAAFAAAALALGALSDGAFASSELALARIRASASMALQAVERWIEPEAAPVRPVAVAPNRRSADYRPRSDQPALAPPSTQRRTSAEPEARPTAQNRLSSSGAIDAPTAPHPATETPEPQRSDVRPSPWPTASIASVAVAPSVPASPVAEPTAMPATVLSEESATAVAAGPAPVIAPAPPAVMGGAGISGVVTFIDETVFPGVTVTAYPLDPRGAVIWPWGVSVRSEPDGSYQILRLRAGRYKVAVGERGPWVYRRWYEDTRHEHAAEPIDVRTGRITEGIDVRTRVWPLGELLVTDPAAALRWLRWY